MSAPVSSQAAAPAKAASGGISTRVLTVAAIALLAASWGFLPDFTVVILSYIGLFAMVAAGLVMLTGVGGMTSFGQAAFVGIGAYATAWVCTAPASVAALGGLVGAAGLPWVGLALGLLITFVVAWLLGAVTVKLQGHYLPLCTIAWGLSLYYLFGNMEFLGGQTGITGIAPLVIGGVSLASPRAMGVVIWAVLLVALWLLHNLLDSREGRAIRALRGGRVMAESMGIDTAHYRVKLFVLAALLATLSGWLYAHMQRFVSPAPFNLNVGIEYLFMAVVGGAGHLWGAVLGATLITLIKQKLQDILPALLGTSGNFEVIVFGLLMVLVLQRFAEGLWPTLQALTARWVRRPVSDLKLADAAPLAQRALPAAGQVLLAAEHVTKRFGGLVANNDVAMTLKAGEVHALIGPNGAGKSTFFNMISGVDSPTEGQVRFMDQAMNDAPSRRFAALGLGRTFQHVRLLGQRSVGLAGLHAAPGPGRGGLGAGRGAPPDRALRPGRLRRCASRLAGPGPAAHRGDRTRPGRTARGPAAGRAGSRPAPPGKTGPGRPAAPAARRGAGHSRRGARHGVRHESCGPHHGAGVRHRDRRRHAGPDPGQPARAGCLPGRRR